jgi:dienelactone hydrolase
MRRSSFRAERCVSKPSFVSRRVPVLFLPSCSITALAVSMPRILAGSRLLQQPKDLGRPSPNTATPFSISSAAVRVFPQTKDPLCEKSWIAKKRAKGEEARNHLQFVLLTTDHLDDVTAALSFLKSLHEVDARRIAVMGHSSGGQLTLLASERDSTLRAAVTFSAVARSWESPPEIRERMLSAVRKTTVPLMLLHAANDYSVVPGHAMAHELASLAKPHFLKIYPPVGKTPGDGHNFVYAAIDQWEDDVFRFLGEHVR